MFKTKLEVDKHVQNCLKKINNETERNLRCFSFAKLYFNVGDYEQACRYVSTYLSVKPKSPEGYNLLGKALEKLGKKKAALEAYRTSLQQDHKQNTLVIKVCELLASEDVELDGSGAKYFCDLAQSIDPHNPVVYSLKERLITMESKNPTEVSQLLLKELESRPTDINLRVRLLKHFLQNNLIKEAYKHASEIEEKKLPIFQNSLNWYEVFAEVLVRYQRDLNYSNSLTWEFWLLSVSVLDKLVTLSLDDHIESVKSTNDYINSLFNFDQMLSKASQNVSSCPDRTLIQTFFTHYQAQLYFHIATLIFKQAKKDLMQFKEASNITLPVLFAAYHVPPPDLQSMWFANAAENRRRLVTQWYNDASFRCSQIGHVLLAAAKDRKSIIYEKAEQYSNGMWREQLFKKVFVKRDQQLKINTSYFVTNSQSLEPIIKLPDHSDMLKYDQTAQLTHPDSLHHHIWIALNNKLSDYSLKSFEGLQYSVKNLNSCSAESINILDIQAFIYCATLCAGAKIEDDKHLIYYNQKKPNVLPAAITQTLGTLNQSKFLKAAYKMYKNEYDSNLGELRLLLIKGIEVVRCVGHHGLDVKVLVTLANVFEESGKKLTKQSEIEANDARAETYWKTALPLLEKIKNNQAVVYPNNRLFEYKSKELTMNEAAVYIEKGKLFLAIQLMKKKEHEKALAIFEELKDPYASFYQSQVYKHMADQITNQNKENVTSEMRSQNIILLSRARDCLYLTLDRLREPTVNRDHPLNMQLGTEIEKMERLLSRIDPDCNNRNECDGMSDENVSSDNSAGEHYMSTYTHTSFQNGHSYTPKHESHNIHSTPLRNTITRHEARPSPERLDAQLRQLTASRDLVLNSVVEQNKMMMETHKSLLEELRGVKEAVNGLTLTVENIKTSIDELRDSVADLQNVTDAIQEVKKDMNELKKDQHKNNQLSDEDLYALDADYSSLDYGMNSNLGASIAGFNNTLGNMYQHYQGARLPNPNPMVAAAAASYTPGFYPGLYPGLYPYNALGLPQPGSLPFVTPDQQLSGIVASLAQQTPSYGQPPLNTSLGMGLIGQGLPQGLTQAKDSPKAPLPIATTAVQNMFSSPIVSTSQSLFSSPVIAATSVSTATIKAPPVNVVITSSDPLPTSVTTTSQPVLSVTIPPHHIKGSVKPHNYQIPIAANSSAPIPSVLSQPPPAISTQSILSNVAPPAISVVAQSKSPSKNVTLGLQIEKKLDQTFSPARNDTLNKSNVSSSSIEEHDPCPDFKPIVPLPDEVPVNTGEEDETQLFCERVKLFRHVINNDIKEWKERGVGNLKILFNPQTGKVRILMRRDQVHKICANHFLTKDMTLTPMTNNDRAYMWAAHDFADEEVVVEKFCARFKTAEEAVKFYNAFEDAKKKISDKPSNDTKQGTKKSDVTLGTVKADVPKTSDQSATSLGGFVFTSTPTFKPKEDEQPKAVEAKKEENQKSPFANFSFSSKPSITQSNLFTTPTTFSPLVVSQNLQEKTASPQKAVDDDTNVDDFVPTAEFKPVIALPDLVEVKTGEENSEILFEEKAKLFRYDTNGEVKEWKERGVGMMKILKEDTVRLVMRRDQIHKVCCNHQVLKNMTFKQNTNNPKTIVWHAQDFSEGELKAETFTIRFKTEEQANNFLKTIQSAQTTMDENNQVSSKHHKVDTAHKPVSFGDKFKPAKGSWECKNCYIVNEGKTNQCLACETSKTGTTAKVTEQSGPSFSFGAKISTETNSSTVTNASGWGNAFKPAEGTWECKICYVRNMAEKDKCQSCETPKEGTAPAPSNKSTLKGINLDTGGLTFSFGMPAATSTTVPQENKINTTTSTTLEKSNKFSFGAPATKTESTSGFGDAFKPKTGSWECKACFVRNDADVLYCASCESPKDDSVPKKEPKGLNLGPSVGSTFTFGMPPATTTASKNLASGDTSTTQFSFKPSKSDSNAGQLFKSTTFTFNPATSSSDTVKEKDDKFVFGSPQKHDFEFKPRSPRKISSGQGDESDASYVEEEEDNIYFKPVIPLPDKVDVKTGEEDEEVLYCHRAKLFRFSNGEWKERGLGDIKILKGKSNGKLRVVMRREQVLKICLNHILSNDIEYLPKDEKTWLFYAADFSEGEISRDQFCVRFKNPEIAQEFKKAAMDAIGGVTSSDKTESKDIDDEVEIVFETTVSPEEEKEALKLGLPPKFMSYRQLPDCSCEQCKKDDEYLKELFVEPKKRVSAINTSSIFGTPQTQSSTPSSGASIFGTPKGQSFSFTPSSGAKPEAKSETLKELLQKPTQLAQSETKPETSSFAFSKTPVFGQQSVFGATTGVTTPVTSTSSSGIFGSSSGGLFGSASKTSIFGNSSPSIFGGGASITPTTTAAGSIFGKTSVFGTPTSGNIFGNTASTATSTGIFNTPTTSASIFGGANTTASSVFGGTPTTATGIFGGTPKTTSSTSIFGGSVAKTSNSSTFGGSNLFGSNTSQNNLFGGTPTSTSIFSSPATTTSSLFGSFTPTTTVSSGGSIFGAATQSTGSIFGSQTFGTTGTLFGSKTDTKPNEASMSFGSTVKDSTSELKESDEPVLKCDTGLTFASLAAKTKPDELPAFAKSSENDKPFSFLGAGAPVFGSAATKKDEKKEKTTGSDDEGGDQNEDEHDPHFEPIVPLPEAIVVSTGEENETALFNERAKLYRYDANTKEWKERGVGQMKILHHPENNTFRLLLRREQVHKVVLNQLIIPDLDVQPMTTSDKAWMWAGYNYTDDENNLEKLAVRFKNVELAQQFKKALDETIAKTKEIQNTKTLPTSVQNYGLEDISSSDEHNQEGNDDEYDDEEDDEDDRSVMFMKRCTLSEKTPNGEWKVLTIGDLQVYYDPELYAARISVSDDSGVVFSNTLIGMNTLMDIEKNECMWKAVEWAHGDMKWKNLKASFSSEMAAQEFHSNYLEGVNYANEVGIIDEIPNENDTGAED